MNRLHTADVEEMQITLIPNKTVKGNVVEPAASGARMSTSQSVVVMEKRTRIIVYFEDLHAGRGTKSLKYLMAFVKAPVVVVPVF